MNIPKSKRSSFFLIVFIITYFYILICSGFSIAAIKVSGVILGDFNATVILSTVVLAGIVAALLVFLNRKFGSGAAEEARGKAREDSGRKLADILIPIVIYVIVLLGRGLYIALILDGKLSGEPWIFARVTDDRFSLIPGEMGFEAPGIYWLYAVFLKPFCMLLGHNAVAVYALNTLCQVIMVCCIYALLKMTVGKAGALAFGVMFLCLPYFYECIAVCEPMHLMAVLVLPVLLLHVRNLRISALVKERKGEVVRRYFLMGILVGVLFFLDPAQIWIPISAMVFYFVNVKKKPLGMPFYLFGIIAGAFAVLAGFGLMLDDGGMILESGLNYLQESITLYEDSLFSLDAYMLFRHNPELLVLIFLSGGIIFLHFKCEHDTLRLAAAPLFMICLACAAGAFQSGTYFVFYCVVVLIASLAYGMLFLLVKPIEIVKPVSREKAKPEQKEERSAPPKPEPPVSSAAEYREEIKPEPEPPVSSAAEYHEEPKPQQSRIVRYYEEPEPVRRAESGEQESGEPKVETAASRLAQYYDQSRETQAKRDASRGGSLLHDSAASDRGDAAQPEQKAKPRMIENPLPVPPRHESKKMDYAYNVPESKMHYDVHSPEDDDYDRVRS